jgi:transcriptional regulator with XRE-family HTH domain
MYEQGRREPPAATLVELSRIFEVTTDYLLTGRPAQRGDAEALSRMVASLVDLTDTRLEQRKNRPFTRHELALLFAAMLTET